MANPSIAIVGLEGSGKTVLMSVLAKRLSETPEAGYYLEPIGNQTMRRADGTWATLQRGEWPPSTPPGEMFDLHWVLHLKRDSQKIDADIRLIDLAGQDTRQLFSNDDIRNETRAHLMPIAEYLSNASIVMFVLNIKDYIAETDDERRIENQAVLKSALDQLSGSKKVLLVFTQLDQYDEYLKQCGGLEAFCRQQIPHIYNAYIREKAVPVLCLAAVNDTQVKIGENGVARRVPVPDFTSRGLDKLCTWIIEKIYAPYKEALERERQELKRQQKVKEKAKKWAITVWIICVIVSMIIGGICGRTYDYVSAYDGVKHDLTCEGIGSGFVVGALLGLVIARYVTVLGNYIVTRKGFWAWIKCWLLVSIIVLAYCLLSGLGAVLVIDP